MINAYEHIVQPLSVKATLVICAVFCLIFALAGNAVIAGLESGGNPNVGTMRFILFATLPITMAFGYFVGIQFNKAHEEAKIYFINLAVLRNQVETALRDRQRPPLPLERYEDKLKLTRGDSLFWAGEAKMMIPKTRTVSTQRVKVAPATKIFGVKLSNAKYKTVRHTERYMAVEGVGFLYVTDKKLVFMSFGQDKNWSKSWDQILSWEPAADSIVVQLPNGTPKTFALPKSGVDLTQDILLCDMCMTLAKEL